MLLLFDVGNTSITYGRYAGGRLLEFGSFVVDGIPKKYKNWSKGSVNSQIDAVISSVSPKKMAILSRNLLKINGLKTWVVGKNLPVPIPTGYQNQKKLGVDRRVNAYGALRMYRTRPILVIDYGTAVTFDLISKKGVFEGGMILPGPEIGFQALIERAALLPKKISLPKKSTTFVGTTTYECMASGILEGYGAMTDGLVDRFKKHYGKGLYVIATGGFAGNLKPYLHSVDTIDPRHSIKSLLLLWKEYQRAAGRT